MVGVLGWQWVQTLYSHFGSFCIVYWKICALTAINLRYITDDYSEKDIF